ncbi:MAG: formate dehydrogenase subunit gamma [Burkholderiales bacterium]|nr:formate dehydrogenase subunit gamma [Burkholderiales bacterium]
MDVHTMTRRWLALLAALFLGVLGSQALAQAAPAGQQTFDSVLNPNAAEQAKRQQQQPGNNAPVWREVRSEKEHYTSTRGVEAGVLIQSGGETWRQRRENQLIPMGALVIAGALGACVLFYLWRGTMRLREKPTGRRMLRFSGFERTMHWTVAISFSILALSGLVMLFGKLVLLPIIGHTLFAWLTVACKTIHNFVGPVFSVAVVVLFFTFVRDNLPSIRDVQWFAKAGGLFSDVHVPSGRFNGGEKVWFWVGVLGLGVTASVSGLILDFPNFGQGRATMQLANVVHVVATVLMMAMAAGHIYMGTAGVEGAYDAMRTGYVDESWAKEHHEYWYEEHKREAVAAPAAGPAGAIPAGAPQAKEKTA